MSCAGLITDWAMAGPVGAVANGARAHAAISADFRRRLFIVLPLIFGSLAVVRRLLVLTLIIRVTATSTCRAARRGRPSVRLAPGGRATRRPLGPRAPPS